MEACRTVDVELQAGPVVHQMDSMYVRVTPRSSVMNYNSWVGEEVDKAGFASKKILAGMDI